MDEQFFRCLHVFDNLFVWTRVAVVWPFLSRLKLLTCADNNKFFIAQLLSFLLRYIIVGCHLYLHY